MAGAGGGATGAGRLTTRKMAVSDAASVAMPMMRSSLGFIEGPASSYRHRTNKSDYVSHIERIHHYSSLLLSNSFTSCGLACPLEAFITCPTKNPIIVLFPARYCSTCL